MKKIYFLPSFVLSLFIIVAITSCNKNDDDDFSMPSITIESPKEDQVFSSGDKIHIKGKLYAGEGISEYLITVTRAGIQHVWSVHEELNGEKHYNFDHSFTWESPDGIELFGAVEIFLYGREQGYLMTNSVSIELNP